MAVSNKKQKKQKGIEEGINTENKKQTKRIYKGEFRDHTRIQCKSESLTQQILA